MAGLPRIWSLSSFDAEALEARVLDLKDVDFKVLSLQSLDRLKQMDPETVMAPAQELPPLTVSNVLRGLGLFVSTAASARHAECLTDTPRFLRTSCSSVSCTTCTCIRCGTIPGRGSGP